MFKLAHFSDPHIGPLPKLRVRQLAGKRVLGWLNWKQGRHDVHRMEILGELLADMKAQKPDHIALTGDVVNLGLPAEYVAARAFLEQLGPAEGLSFVPGNHDAYTRNSPARLLHAFDPWMRGDDAGAHPLDEAERFPYVRIRNRIALVGVSSAVPTGPFMATGRVGIRQMSRLRDTLEHLGHEGYCRVIMIHHPVRRQDAAPTAMLVDADHFQRAVRAAGAELILHGHIHNGAIHHVKGRNGPVPAVCVPSASAAPERSRWPASYNLFRIREERGRWRIRLTVRGFVSLGYPPQELRSETLS